MKTLGKLEINHERILENDELKSLKGGYWYGPCWIYYYTRPGVDLQYISASSQDAAQSACGGGDPTVAYCNCG